MLICRRIEKEVGEGIFPPMLLSSLGAAGNRAAGAVVHGVRETRQPRRTRRCLMAKRKRGAQGRQMALAGDPDAAALPRPRFISAIFIRLAVDLTNIDGM